MANFFKAAPGLKKFGDPCSKIYLWLQGFTSTPTTTHFKPVALSFKQQTCLNIRSKDASQCGPQDHLILWLSKCYIIPKIPHIKHTAKDQVAKNWRCLIQRTSNVAFLSGLVLMKVVIRTSIFILCTMSTWKCTRVWCVCVFVSLVVKSMANFI